MTIKSKIPYLVAAALSVGSAEAYAQQVGGSVGAMEQRLLQQTQTRDSAKAYNPNDSLSKLLNAQVDSLIFHPRPIPYLLPGMKPAIKYDSTEIKTAQPTLQNIPQDTLRVTQSQGQLPLYLMRKGGDSLELSTPYTSLSQGEKRDLARFMIGKYRQTAPGSGIYVPIKPTAVPKVSPLPVVQDTTKKATPVAKPAAPRLQPPRRLPAPIPRQTQQTIEVPYKVGNDSLTLTKPFESMNAREIIQVDSILNTAGEGRRYKLVAPGIYVAERIQPEKPQPADTAKARADRIRAAGKKEEISSRQKTRRLSQFGLGAGVGFNEDPKFKEAVVGVFANVPVSKTPLRLEAYAAASVPEAYFYSLRSDTDTTMRQVQAIGPTVNKNRTDYITTTLEAKLMAEFGGRVGLELFKDRLMIYVGSGAKVFDRQETTDGRSNISFVRGTTLLGQEEISKKTQKSYLLFRPAGEAGLRLNLLKNFSAEASAAYSHGEFRARFGGKLHTPGKGRRGRK